jgi:pimeloyl-ACP methyl ester carboxylesterase
MLQHAPTTQRAFAALPDGIVHYATAGEGDAVLLLHQTPRSWDEYRDVLPLIGGRYQAIAMDTIGFGDSSRPSWPPTVEGFARVAVDLLDALGIERAALVGHHTGGSIAIEIAAGYPERVSKIVLSSTPLVDEATRREWEGDTAVMDDVEFADDGSHLAAMWQMRLPLYPAGRSDLLTRFMIDALKAGDFAALGHKVVGAYEMEKRLPLVKAPALVVAGADDPYALPYLHSLAAALPGSRAVEIPGGMVPMPDQMPEEFARVVLEFLDGTPAP